MGPWADLVSGILPDVPVVVMSCLRGDVKVLLSEISSILGPVAMEDSAPMLTRPRHRAHVERVEIQRCDFLLSETVGFLGLSSVDEFRKRFSDGPGNGCGRIADCSSRNGSH